MIPFTFAAISNSSIVYYMPLDNSTPYYNQCTVCNNIATSNVVFINSSDGFNVSGSSSYIGVGDTGTLNGKNWTYAGWYKIFSRTGVTNMGLYAQAVNGANPDSSVFMVMNYGGKQSLSIYSTWSGDAWKNWRDTPNQSIQNETWVSFVIVKTNTTLQVYINGTNQTLGGGGAAGQGVNQTYAIAENLFNAVRPELVGGLNGSPASNYPSFHVKNVALWSRALTTAEILEFNSSGREALIFASPSPVSTLYTANISLRDFMGNLVTTPFTAIVNNTNYTNGTNIQMYNGTAYNITIVSYVYSNKTQEYTLTQNNTVLNMTNLAHKFPAQFSYAYLMNTDGNVFFDANSSIPLKKYGTVLTQNISSYINQSNITTNTYNNPTNYLYNETSWFTNAEMTAGWTISFKYSIKNNFNNVQPWILDNSISGANGTEIFCAKDDDASSNYSLICGVWGNGANEIELTNGVIPRNDTMYHVALRYNTTSLCMYVDGQKVQCSTQALPFGLKTPQQGVSLFALPAGATIYEGMNGTINSLYVYKYALSDGNCADDSGLVCSGEIGTLYYTPYEYNTAFVNTSLFGIVAHDFYTNESITNFSATIGGTVYNTTNGTIYINLTDSSLYTILVNATNYYNHTYTGINITSSLNVSMYQSEITFLAYEKVTNNLLSGANFTTSYLRNTTHYMKSGTYSVTASKSGYYDKTASYTASALTTTTANISYMSSAILNLTVRHAITNALVTTYTAQLNYTGNSFSENQSTTNGSAYIYSITGDHVITVDAAGYAITSVNATFVSGVNNITAYIYTTESVWFKIYNEENESLLYQPNTTVELIGSYASYNVTTSNNASIYLDLITPDAYIVRYYATGFTPRFGYVEVTDRSTQNVSLYLAPAPSTTNITLTVREQDGSTIEDALVKVLKYDLDTNSYIVQNEVLTDYNGQAIVDVYFNSEYYKFIVEYPVGLVGLETSPAYIISTDITLVISSDVVGANYRYIADAAGSVTYNTATYNFRFTWSDTYHVVQEACLYVFRLENNYTASFVGNNCSTASAGTILISIPNSTQAEYYAVGQFEIADQFYEVDTAWADLRAVNNWGLLGLFIAIGLTVTITFIFIKIGPQAAVLSVPFGITFTNVTGITQFAAWVPVAILGLCLIIIFAMGRDK